MPIAYKTLEIVMVYNMYAYLYIPFQKHCTSLHLVFDTMNSLIQ